MCPICHKILSNIEQPLDYVQKLSHFSYEKVKQIKQFIFSFKSIWNIQLYIHRKKKTNYINVTIINNNNKSKEKRRNIRLYSIIIFLFLAYILYFWEEEKSEHFDPFSKTLSFFLSIPSFSIAECIKKEIL